MKSIEEQKKEMEEHRDGLEGPGVQFIFMLTYGSLISPFQRTLKTAVKNKDGSDANLDWQQNIPKVYQGFMRARNMHKYDDKVSVEAFATDGYELTREEYRNAGFNLTYDAEAQDVFRYIAEKGLSTTDYKITDVSEVDEEEKGE